MRLIVHDFSGHPFQAELARALAQRGHDVLHVQCSSYTSGKGSFASVDGEGPEYVAVSIGESFERRSPRRRLWQEVQYSRRFTSVAADFGPDLVISCNDPLIAKAGFALWAERHHVPWIYWLQDLYSIAMSREAERRSRAGSVLGALFRRTERMLLRASDAIVAITEDFDPILREWRVDLDKRVVIENWAPLDEVPPRPRLNDWRRANGLADDFVYLYAGTLGRKHNPDVLHTLATSQPDAKVVVVSEGLGADRLRTLKTQHPAPNLCILPFQQWEALPDVLGAADVLVVLLEAEAGVFSVPSKVLTSLCAGRPIVAAVPRDNLAARIITGSRTGVVVEPNDVDALVKAAEGLRADPTARAAMGANGRAYAEANFDITTITGRFEGVIERVVRSQ